MYRRNSSLARKWSEEDGLVQPKLPKQRDLKSHNIILGINNACFGDPLGELDNNAARTRNHCEDSLIVTKPHNHLRLSVSL